MMLLYEAFESQVTRQPYAIALTDGAQNLTYAELNAQANRLAHRLLKAGAGADVCVGLYLEA
ncbi:MAG: AMP-binding protein, partial [Gammaproteobacteria bacterium]|nr:AMP-binding protein [Gammaproteobacteria bacterium]